MSEGVSKEAVEALKQRVDFPWDESREFKDGFQAALGQVESILTERDEAVDLLEAERKSPTSVERGEEFAAGFDAGQTEARNRWEQEVRERLMSDEVIEQISNQIWVDPVRTALDMALDAIFGEAEPNGN